ncbi:MAG: hypothetical protein K9N46_11780 [Candidatus Marinimicrobia bacterium]|nr:hypothetical protein [Candidatus Neomarinimicrobiota bacterium]MCF7827359.1 hypothetical protein [Candidatus Neomarinimicrobiota bacterium]MCF7881408.1 hypothetical protein [Candidatus Neomarinimicrobiota bacterium]
MDFTNREMETDYSELQQTLTAEGKNRLYDVAGISKLKQSTFHQVMQQSRAGDEKRHESDVMFALVNEFEVTETGELQLIGEFLALGTLESQGLVEISGTPDQPVEAVQRYIDKVVRHIVGRIQTPQPAEASKRPEVKSVPSPSSPSVERDFSGRAKDYESPSERDNPMAVVNQTIETLMTLLRSDSLYRFTARDISMKATSGSGSGYEVWMPVILEPGDSLRLFLRHNRFVKCDGEYCIVTLPALTVESAQPEFREMLRHGYGEQTVRAALFTPAGDRIQPSGHPQYLKKDDEYNSLGARAFSPMHLVQTGRQIKIYFLAEQQSLEVVVPVDLGDSERIDRVKVGLEP